MSQKSIDFMYLLQKSEIMSIDFFVAVCSSICLSLSLSVHVEQLRSNWTDVYYILYLRISQKCVKKFRFD